MPALLGERRPGIGLGRPQWMPQFFFPLDVVLGLVQEIGLSLYVGESKVLFH